MAGIYIHIPFCKQACNYCNFYFSTSLHFKESFLNALLQEISIQKEYLTGESIESIYFGGGTPSILATQEIVSILNQLSKSFPLQNDLEICLEANPDDLSPTKLQDLYSLGINRLSIGTQSFQQQDLAFMKRAHNDNEALDCIRNASAIGFKDLSIDLIYGVPTQSFQTWKENLAQLNDLEVNHLSCYALTVEDNTALYHQIKKGKVANVNETQAAQHFELLQEWAESNNWQHYEISNFCKEENYSKHNTSYWQGKKYLGLGPAAHSYNIESRQWNVANLKHYIDGIKNNDLKFEKEVLSKKDQFNEKVMTGLRTSWGINKSALSHDFPQYYVNFLKDLQSINPNWIVDQKEIVTLSKAGKFYADGIAANLFQE